MRNRLLMSAFALGAAAVLPACGSTSTPASTTSTVMADKSTPMADTTTAMPDKSGTPAAMTKGAYLSYADYQSSMATRQGTKVVLFFHAPWCPDCRATESALNASGVPDGLTVVNVDYDTSTELKSRYGITQQHTFVQIDPNGGQVKKWTGTKDGVAIKAQTA